MLIISKGKKESFLKEVSTLAIYQYCKLRPVRWPLADDVWRKPNKTIDIAGQTIWSKEHRLQEAMIVDPAS